MQRSLIANWIPFKLSHSAQDDWTLKWMHLENIRMIHPFFDETIQSCRCQQIEKSNLESFSTPDFLPVAGQDLESLAPSSFIFHVSRCGSTLLSQAFSEPEENIVIAEAPLFDEILRATEKQADLSTLTREVWFKSAIKFMGQKRNFKETSYIIKLDSWHIHFYELLREWYPQTPFFFLYRQPDEVIASHDKRRGLQSIPGMIDNNLLKTEQPASFGGDFNGYTAQVLEQYFLKLQNIHADAHPKNYFFNYADGSKKMVGSFSQFTGIPIRDPEKMNTRLGFHSKSSKEIFKPETHQEREKFFYRHCHTAYEQLNNNLSIL